MINPIRAARRAFQKESRELRDNNLQVLVALVGGLVPVGLAVHAGGPAWFATLSPAVQAAVAAVTLPVWYVWYAWVESWFEKPEKGGR